MANVVYNSFKRDVLNGTINLAADNIYVMLVTSTYVPDQDLHTKRSDITNEVSGTGYTAGGQALATKVVSVDNTGNRGFLDADDSIWANSTITARAAVLYKNRGGLASADELIGYVDFASDFISTNGNFTINWAATGILEAL